MSFLTMIALPWPPSVNHYWRTFRGRMILSKAGREYRKAAVAVVEQFAHNRYDKGDRLKCTIETRQPDNRRRDVDNIAKAVLDAIGHAGLWDDDSQIDELRIKRGPVHRPCGFVLVDIERIEEVG